MSRWLVFVAVAACGGTSSPTTSTEAIANVAPTRLEVISAVCPQSMAGYEWSRELFPGCPPKPFHWIGTTCTDRCPTPCASSNAVHTYDDQGRWVLSIYGRSLKSFGTGYESVPPPPGGRYCTRHGDQGTCEVMRDRYGDENRVVEATLRYDESGNVVSFQTPRSETPDATFEWAGSHQLVVEKVSNPLLTTYRYDYDARGRISHISSTSRCCDTLQMRYTYDDASSLLTKVVQEYSTGTRFSYTIEYDTQRRPVHFVLLREERSGPAVTEEDIFQYDCPARPSFEDALVMMEKFKAKTCACTDHACSARVSNELEQWQTRTDPVERNADQIARFGKLSDEINACMR